VQQPIKVGRLGVVAHLTRHSSVRS
jgi:hypothetical protein